AARQLAAWLHNNAACNCVTPRLLVTCRDWPQRPALLAHLQRAVAALPVRTPFDPRARQNFARAAARDAPEGPLPFVLRTDVDLDREPWLAAEEMFAPVLVETSLAGPDAPSFAARAAALVRERVFGALAAHLLAPPPVLLRERAAAAALIAQLRHGTV